MAVFPCGKIARIPNSNFYFSHATLGSKRPQMDIMTTGGPTSKIFQEIFAKPELWGYMKTVVTNVCSKCIAVKWSNLMMCFD